MPKINDTFYGLLAEFASAESLLEASDKTYQAGYRKIDAYSPFPVEGLSESIGFKKNRIPLLVLIGGILGGGGGLLFQYWVATVANPYNIGGRPLASWPAFIPVTFEMTVLIAGIFAVLGMLALNGLPMPYHPVFHVPGFALASRNKFFLLIESSDPLFDKEQTQQFLSSLTPTAISEVHR
jgi:hypothetical protein